MSDKKNKIDFQDLMLYRIHEILLVASPYDAFILEEDGKLTEQILTEYLGLNLSYAPRVWNAPTAKKADEMLEKRFFDIIIWHPSRDVSVRPNAKSSISSSSSLAGSSLLNQSRLTIT